MAQKSTTKKSTAKSGAKKNQKKGRTRSERLAVEVFGVVLVALGALFGVYLYSGSDGVLGSVIRSFLLGMTGVFAYVVPVFFVIFGFVIILSGRQKRSRGTYFTAVVAVYCVICIVHLASSNSLASLKQYGTDGYVFKDYLQQWFAQFPVAWNEPIQFNVGGGVLGMFFMAPLYMLSPALCWIVTIAALIICLLVLTGISIKAYTDAFGTRVKDRIETVKNEYFAEDDAFEEDEAPAPPKVRLKDFTLSDEKKTAKNRQKLSFDELFEVPEPEQKPARSSAKKTPAYEAPAYNAPVAPTSAEQRPVSRLDPNGAEFMPSTGKLKRKSSLFVDVDEEDIPLYLPDDEPAPKPAKTGAPSSPSKVSEAVLGTPVETPAFRSTAQKPAKAEPETNEEDLPIAVPDAPSSNAVPLYLPPSIDCLNRSDPSYSVGAESPQATARLLEETLQSFNISAEVVNVSVGPVVTRYELKPAPGVRVSKIAALADDLALALAAARVRIEAPIPGKSAVGIEVPNKETATVLLGDIIESAEFQNAKSPSTMALGKDITGKIVVADLAKMPHMLIAGSTGSGKSVCINGIILSMIYKSSPQDIQMILIDPKVVELSVFGTLPHLRVPVVTEPKKAASALRWAVNEMDQRYRKFSEVGSRDLARYNSLTDDPKKRMAKLVIIIDELADLMMVAPEDVEDSICRIAQLGRAAGIHLIVATQRPSADIITGLIKANIPSRCAFAVSSSIDSRIILDATGAEKLLGRGDMLFHPNGAGKPTRCQGALVTDEEVERVMSHFKKENVQFDEQTLSEINNEAKGGAQGGVFGEGKQEDDLLGEAVRIVMENGQASISMIQRRLRVGYARAARLVDMMEQAKYVSGFDGSKPRQVLITPAEYNRVFGGAVDPEADPIPADDADDVPFDGYEGGEE